MENARDGFTRSYSTPVDLDSRRAAATGRGRALELAGYDLDSGRQLWRMEGLARIVNPRRWSTANGMYVATWSPGGDTDARIAMEPWSYASEKWDTDHNGKLTRSEVHNKEVLDRFYRIDLNQDQSLDQAEWTKYAAIFERAKNSLVAIGPAAGRRRRAASACGATARGCRMCPARWSIKACCIWSRTAALLRRSNPLNGELVKQGAPAAQADYYASPVAGDGKVYLVSEAGVISVLRPPATGKCSLRTTWASARWPRR